MEFCTSSVRFWGGALGTAGEAKHTLRLWSPARCCRARRPPTVRQRADGDVLGGDAGAVLVVGYHTEAVLGVLLQAGHGVGLSVHVHVLNEGGGNTVVKGSRLHAPPTDDL